MSVKSLVAGGVDSTFTLYRDYSVVGKEMKESFLKSKTALAKNAERFVFKLSDSNDKEGILGLSYGSFLLLTLLDRFDLDSAFSLDEKKKLHNSIMELLAYVKNHGFDVSPFSKDETNEKFFKGGRTSFIESLTWSMSCFLYARRMSKNKLLDFEQDELDDMTEMIAKSLVLLVDNVIRPNGELGYVEGCEDYLGWGPLTGCLEASLYFTHSVCETFGDIEDTMLGNAELGISKDWEFIAKINEACSKLPGKQRKGGGRQIDIVDQFQQICLVVGKNVFKKYEKSLGKKFFYADGSEIQNNEQISYSLQSPVLLNQIYVVLTTIYVNYHNKVREDEGEEAFKELGAILKNAVDMVHETYTDLRRKGKENIVNREYATFTEKHPNKEIGQKLGGERINVAVLEALIIKARAMIITYVSKYPEKEIGDVLDIIEKTRAEDDWLWSHVGYDLQQTERSISAIREFYDYYEGYQKACAEKNSEDLQAIKDDYESKYQALSEGLKSAQANYEEQLRLMEERYKTQTETQVQEIKAQYKLEGVVREIVEETVKTSFVDLLTSTLDKIAQDNKTAKDTLGENEKKVKESISNFVGSFLLPFNFSVNNVRANSAWAESDQELLETMKADLSSFIEEWMYQVCRKNRPGAQDKETVLRMLFDDKNQEK
ncbi:MAG: hypothetical protein J6A38_01415 [Clostridia bacterium]|nr:hypothetical protein [Clostridia bacterium]